MNNTALTEKLKEVVIKAVSSSIDRSDIVSHIYREFYDSCNASTEKIKAVNKLVMDALEAIAMAFSVDLSCTYDAEEKVSTLRRAIIKKSQTEQPKQRYLIFGYSDDCGHSHCTCVTSKDFEFFNEVFNMHDQNESFEHLYYKDSKLLKAMGERLQEDINELRGLRLDDLLGKLREFFNILVADNAVSREEFSEYLECVINDGRMTGRSKSWVVI